MGFIDDDKEELDDCLLSRLIFAQALDALILPGQGVLVELHGEALNIGVERVIVHNNPETNEIGVLTADERTDLKHGDRITIIKEDDIIN